MLWVYMIYLGTNMWNEGDSLTRFNKNDAFFHKEMFTDRKTWRAATDFAIKAGFNAFLVDIGEGLQLEAHPELAASGAWTKEEMKAELDRLKASGATVIPKLNLSATHDAWLNTLGHKLNTPEYFKAVREIIDEVIELFQPPIIHLGFDEESHRERNMQNKYGYSSYRYGEEYALALNYFVKCALDKGVRPWLWAGLATYSWDEFAHYSPHDAIYGTCNYEQMRNTPKSEIYYQMLYDSARKLEKLGYDQLPAVSTCYDYYSVDDTMEFWKSVISPKHFIGVASAPWCRTGKDDLYSLMAEAKVFAYARKKYYPETFSGDLIL